MNSIIDINVSVGAWPFQAFDQKTLADTAQHLNVQGIDEAYVSHLGGVFNPDAASSNEALVTACEPFEHIHPVLTVNPAFPGWQRHVERCRTRAQVKAIKLFPTYHNYSLASEVVDEVVAYVTKHNLRLLLTMRLEDERTRYFALNVVGLPVEDVIAFSERYPALDVVCLNAYLPEAKRLGQETEQVFVDTSFTDWFFVFEELRQDMDLRRVFFGSHTPFLYTAASLKKVAQSRLSTAEKALILSGNARRFFG